MLGCDNCQYVDECSDACIKRAIEEERKNNIDYGLKWDIYHDKQMEERVMKCER